MSAPSVPARRGWAEAGSGRRRCRDGLVRGLARRRLGRRKLVGLGLGRRCRGRRNRVVLVRARRLDRMFHHSWLVPWRRASQTAGRRFRLHGDGYVPIMAALIAAFLAVLLLAFGFAFAAPWLVIVPIAIVMLFLAWTGTLAAAHWTPQDAVRRTKH